MLQYYYHWLLCALQCEFNKYILVQYAVTVLLIIYCHKIKQCTFGNVDVAMVKHTIQELVNIHNLLTSSVCSCIGSTVLCHTVLLKGWCVAVYSNGVQCARSEATGNSPGTVVCCQGCTGSTFWTHSHSIAYVQRGMWLNPHEGDCSVIGIHHTHSGNTRWSS